MPEHPEHAIPHPAPHPIMHQAQPAAREHEAAVIKEGNISLILDGYDDIFSDFDPRPYELRALSDDFLHECRQATRDKDGRQLEVRLLIPKDRRNAEHELHIKHRLHEHFQKHYREQEHLTKEVKHHGVLMAVTGAYCLTITVVLHSLHLPALVQNILITLFEPAGWFLSWIGFEQIIFGVKERKPEHDFYRRMSSAQISFFSY